jgi:uncharacterized protein YkwD
MLRALLVSFAMLAVSCSLRAAEDNPSDRDVSHKQPTPQSNSAAGTTSREDSAAENELLQEANKSREQAGVPTLRMDETLRQAARAHALLMIQNERLEHQFSGEPALLERIAQVISPDSLLKIDRAGENVAYATCASGANNVLMQSAPHRHNLLDGSFNVAGVAAIWFKGRLYVVQDFAHNVPTYSAEQSRKLVVQAVDEMRQQAGLPALVQITPPDLDEAACELATEDRPNAHLLAAAYTNRKFITYTQSRPDALPQAAMGMLRDPRVRQLSVGSCYARNAAYPTGMYWIAILLY